jgi:hypothetical protein
MYLFANNIMSLELIVFIIYIGCMYICVCIID